MKEYKNKQNKIPDNISGDGKFFTEKSSTATHTVKEWQELLF